MSEKELDTSIREFKGFLTNHPKLIRKVRKSGESWQPYFEKWVLLGETDPCWDRYKQDGEENKKQSTNFMDKLRKWTESTDMDQIQDHVKQWDHTITIIQGMLNQFLESKQEKGSTRNYDENNYRD